MCSKLNNEYKIKAIVKRIKQKIIILLQINKIFSTNLNKHKFNKLSF